MKSVNCLEVGISPKQISVQLSDEFPRVLTIRPFERKDGCLSLSHWLFLALVVGNFQFRQRVFIVVMSANRK